MAYTFRGWFNEKVARESDNAILMLWTKLWVWCSALWPWLTMLTRLVDSIPALTVTRAGSLVTCNLLSATSLVSNLLQTLVYIARQNSSADSSRMKAVCSQLVGATPERGPVTHVPISLLPTVTRHPANHSCKPAVRLIITPLGKGTRDSYLMPTHLSCNLKIPG